MHKQSVEELIDRYLAGSCTPKEKALIERFYMEELLNRKLPQGSDDPMLAKDAMWSIIAETVQPGHAPKQNKRLRFYRSVSAAAAVIIIVGLAFYFYPQNNINRTQVVKQGKRIDINPGGNKAILTLGNGEQVDLNEARDGILLNQAGVVIKKTKDGQLVYSTAMDYILSDDLSFNTISTPKGGQYHVILPDGTGIWLNAATTVRFPTRFIGKERSVSLTGEAYFEVAKNKKMPFKVTTDQQITEVLGTHFNINSYPDEKSIRTTLLEGSVRVSGQMKQSGTPQNVVLKPGEQYIGGADVKVVKADLQEVMAWKNNRFTFNSKPLEDIMRQISRWYNVDIEYKGDISGKEFTGTISRYANVSQVLKMLEFTNLVHFKIEERRIIVMP